MDRVGGWFGAYLISHESHQRITRRLSTKDDETSLLSRSVLKPQEQNSAQQKYAHVSDLCVISKC